MGKRRVEVKRIQNPTSRQVTFSKRRNGLKKKACELSVLCDVEVALIVFSATGRMCEFASHGMDKTIEKYLTFNEKRNNHTDRHCIQAIENKEVHSLEQENDILKNKSSNEGHNSVASPRILSINVMDRLQFQRDCNVYGPEASATITRQNTSSESSLHPESLQLGFKPVGDESDRAQV